MLWVGLIKFKERSKRETQITKILIQGESMFSQRAHLRTESSTESETLSISNFHYFSCSQMAEIYFYKTGFL